MTITKNITIAVDNGIHSEILTAHQGEKLSRIFVFNFVANNQEISLETSDKVICIASYKGKIIETIDGTVNTTNNTVTVKLTSNCTALSGNVQLKLNITQSTSILISEIINLHVYAAPNGSIFAPNASESYIDPKQLQSLICYPNHSVNIMSNAKNFTDVTGWAKLNTEAIEIDNNNLVLKSSGSAGMYGRLTKSITLDGDGDKLILIKIRALLAQGGSAKIVPCWRLNVNGDYIHPASVVASNLTSDTASNVYWQLSESNKWQDLWLIAQRKTDGTDYTLNDVGLFVQSTATVYISHYQVFYSQD